MKMALFAVGALGLVVTLVLLVGSLLPKAHRVAREAALRRAPRDVYDVVRDFAKAPTWRPDLVGMEMLDAADNRPRFRECGKHGCVTYEVMEDVPGQRLVIRIVDQNLGYSGSWTYDFSPTPSGMRLRIEEQGEVSNLLFRFMSRFVFGQTATLDAYLDSLGKRFEEPDQTR